MEKKYQFFVSSTYEDLKEEESAPIWRTSRVEHDGNGYYIVGFNSNND